MKLIVSNMQTTKIAKAMNLDYSYVRRCMRFEKNGPEAVRVRSHILRMAGTQLINL